MNPKLSPESAQFFALLHPESGCNAPAFSLGIATSDPRSMQSPPDDQRPLMRAALAWIELLVIAATAAILTFAPTKGVAATPPVDDSPPVLVSAHTFGSPNQVTVVFSKSMAPGASITNFTIDNGISVTGVAPDLQPATLLLATTAITPGKSYTLTVNGVSDLSGHAILPDSKIPIDLSVQMPLDYGQTINGFQDEFSGPDRDPNWVAEGAGGDLYTQANGVLTIPMISGDPNHLLYEAPGYNAETQEVLARLKVNHYSDGGGSRAGIAVAGNPQATHPGEAIDMIFAQGAGDFGAWGNVALIGPGFKLLDDWVTWGPTVLDSSSSAITWQTNTWYWFRLRQDSSSTATGPNIHAKVWPADGSVAEPLGWQTDWSEGGRSGFAGIDGPTGGDVEVEMDYFLLKADGLPQIKVLPNAFTDAQNIAIAQDPASTTVGTGATATFAVVAIGQNVSNLTYQWQKAPSGSAIFDNIAGATSPSYTTPATSLSDSGAQFKCIVSVPGITRTSGAATLLVDSGPPVLVSARTLGNPNQVTVVFSKAIASGASVTNFTIDNGITVTGVTPGPQSSALLLATTAITLGKDYTVTVSGVGDLFGHSIQPNSKIPINLFVELPSDDGQTVSGFQDDFNGSVRDSNWVAEGEGGDSYVQANGVLKVPMISGDPNHLLYEAPGYNAETQEVLARIKVNFTAGGTSRAGIAVAGDPAAGHPGEAINLWFSNGGGGGTASGLVFVLLDDLRAVGPIVLGTNSENITWQTNTWYWLRLRQDSGSTEAGPNIHAKAWLADGSAAEPVGWQTDWAREGRTGFAGIEGPSGGDVQFEVDYFLLKADGLPQIKVTPGVFALRGPPPNPKPTIELSIIRTGNQLSVSWTGGGTLESAQTVTGPWAAVSGATSPSLVDISTGTKFYRVQR
jgi:hypothetical protein